MIKQILQAIWWDYLPGKKIRVSLPKMVHVDPFFKQYISIDQVTPPEMIEWLEQNVGRRGIDWQAGMEDKDFHEEKLTIKFRIGKTHHASVAYIKWG